MKNLEEMTTAREADIAYGAALRNLPPGTHSAIVEDSSPKDGDGPQLLHTKAAYRRWQELLREERDDILRGIDGFRKRGKLR